MQTSFFSLLQSCTCKVLGSCVSNCCDWESSHFNFSSQIIKDSFSEHRCLGVVCAWKREPLPSSLTVLELTLELHTQRSARLAYRQSAGVVGLCRAKKTKTTECKLKVMSLSCYYLSVNYLLNQHRSWYIFFSISEFKPSAVLIYFTVFITLANISE